MIKSLQSLRGIFALLILLSHYKIGPDVILPCGGDCGVAFFIMLSGFVLSAGYSDRLSHHDLGFRTFMSRRLFKIYPLHLLCFIWAVFLYHYFDPLTAAANLTATQSWIPSSSFYFSYNAVSWFISDALFFYLMFPLLLKCGFGCSRNSIIAFAAVAAGYVATTHLIPADLETAIIYVNPLARLIDFCIGMLLYRLFASRQFSCLKAMISDRLGFTIKSLIELSAVAAFTAMIIYYPDIAGCYALSSYWWAVMAMLILMFSVTDGNGGVVTRLLRLRPAVAFGSISFGFYMTHVLVIGSFGKAAALSGITLPEPARFVAVVAVTAMIATVYHRLIEPKIKKILC